MSRGIQGAARPRKPHPGIERTVVRVLMRGAIQSTSVTLRMKQDGVAGGRLADVIRQAQLPVQEIVDLAV